MKTRNHLERTTCRRSGVIVFLVAIALAFVVGLAGLVTDLGRMYITKSELQAFVDAAALAGIVPLDGTKKGINNSKKDAALDVNHWGFGTETVPTKVIEYATTLAGPWDTNPTDANGVRYIRVTASADMPLYLTQVIPTVGSSQVISATATAGMIPQLAIGDGVFPVSPDVHDPLDPDYGFRMGELYTLVYDLYTGPVATCDDDSDDPICPLNSINGYQLVGCPGDMAVAGSWQPGFANGTPDRSQRGFVNLSDREPSLPGGGANLLRDGILGRLSYNLPIEIGYTLTMEPGAKTSLLTEMKNRVLQDTDSTTPSFFTTKQTGTNTPTAYEMNSLHRSAYTVTTPAPPNGNGRRIIFAPVNEGVTDMVVGFASFYLPNEPCGDMVFTDGKTYNPCCGEYLGEATFNGGSAVGPGAGLYRAALVQ
jgi:hypothetical protein